VCLSKVLWRFEASVKYSASCDLDRSEHNSRFNRENVSWLNLLRRNGESSAFTTTIHPEVVSEIMYLNVIGLNFETLSKYLGVAFG